MQANLFIMDMAEVRQSLMCFSFIKRSLPDIFFNYFYPTYFILLQEDGSLAVGARKKRVKQLLQPFIITDKPLLTLVEEQRSSAKVQKC